MYHRRMRAAIIVGMTLMVCAELPAQDAPIIRARTDLVHFGVTVTDRQGNVVPGLGADAFEVVENGTRQTITSFAVGSDAAPDLHVGVMFDSSESMLAAIDAARTAAIRFLNRLPEAVDITLVDFADDVRVSQFSQDDFPQLVERIRGGTVKGQTALYDAFTMYLAGTRDAQGRHVLAVFTDGGNSTGNTRYTNLIELARASQVTIYVVGLLEHQSPSARSELEVRMRRIAEETGGRAIFPYSLKQIDEAYDRIIEEIRSQYSIGYVSTDLRQDGRWRPVQVRLVRPEHKNLRVRTRGGYYAAVGQDKTGDRR
jgi:Ca-activated chloride channel family protein